MFESLADPQVWIALTTLTFLEIVLGIDNIIFISILAGKPRRISRSARAGSGYGRDITRSAALLARGSSADATWFTVLGQAISGRDLILILGGLFLMARAPTTSTTSWRREEVTRPSECRRRSERDRPDHAPRHRVLARLRDHRRRMVDQLWVW